MTFLDVEAATSRTALEVIDGLRADYGNQVQFVVRHFTIPRHVNSEPAAVAAEAAHRQDVFDPMYRLLFDSQPDWAEQGTPRPEVFRELAEQLGLDLAAYDAAIADPTTLERVRADVRDGEAAEVTGTPTFFLDGQRVGSRTRPSCAPASTRRWVAELRVGLPRRLR